MRGTTHEWVCVSCGVRLRGRSLGGEIRATNAPASGRVLPCLCKTCEERETSEEKARTWHGHAAMWT